MNSYVYISAIFIYFFLPDATDVLKKVPGQLEVQNLLNDIHANWNIIGIALEVDSSTLQDIHQISQVT